MAGWNAATCTHCWVTHHPDREPVRVIDADYERCSNCGRITRSGIYRRMRPEDQNYPTMEEVDG